MRQKWLATTWIQMAAVGLLVAGCSGDPAVNSRTSGDLDLSSAFGGYDDADEAPVFGDATMAAYLAEDEPLSDPSFASEQIDSLMDLPGARVFRLAIRWGMLAGDSTNTTVTDWSGSVRLRRGAVAVRRLIRFERGQDYVVRPRENRSRLDWVSATSVNFDGLLLVIIDPPVPPDSNWPANALEFTTTPYAHSFSIDELASLDEMVTVDQLGNQIAFNGRELDLEPCGGGPLEGVWARRPSDSVGHFFGKWMSTDGALTGHLRGHFGIRANGERVFFGKYIGPAGHVRGLLRGTWGEDPNDANSGWFAGIWAARDGLPVGTLHGRWHAAPREAGVRDRQGPGQMGFEGVDWNGGFFSGSWERSCLRPDSTSGPGA
ncbi:MAG: hypothetical protein AB1792_00650 [Candidatus Zixiibacteriota bacterium]